MRSFGNLVEFEAVFGRARLIYVLGGRRKVTVEDLNLKEGIASVNEVLSAARSVGCSTFTHKVVTILKVAAHS